MLRDGATQAVRFCLPMKAAVIRGPARVDRRTKNLVRRLQARDIAVIAHQDLDALAAQMLADRHPKAVLNALDSVSGRYPNRGPTILLDAGIPLIDCLGEGLMSSAREGMEVSVEDDTVRAGGTLFKGRLVTKELVAERHQAAEARLHEEFARFVENTLLFVREEKALLAQRLELPPLKVPLLGQQCVVVVRGPDFDKDLRTIRAYLADRRPVVIAVDGAADEILHQGLPVHLLLGDMDSVSERALRSAKQVVVHAYQNGSAPGMARAQAAGVEADRFLCPGTSEDAALLLAHEAGAQLIVTVGSHTSMADFLDKGRAGMASTFLTRLRVGGRVVDARGVSALHVKSSSLWYAVGLPLAGIATALLLVLVSPGARNFLQLAGMQLHFFFRHLRHWLGL